ncbi:MAG: hypothetical protein E6J90_30245 [Deltaproteobacteria bacterium]|nr:MAG: hypothetical protein E6J90_30245 [Deltaproteobacteria bacterium]TMQ19933.1 MAG: hypothetical protein E6J91_05175 [Deltaproteobacteria bacterium]
MCFGCSETFAPELLETVGDAVFCRSCLGRMLRRVDERAAAPGKTGSRAGSVRADRVNGTRAGGEGPLAERARSPRTAAADAPCFLCGEPLEDRAVIELHGFTICGRCARSLVGDDPGGDAAGDTAGDTAGVNDRTCDDDAATAERPTGPARLRGGDAHDEDAIETPGSGTEWCSSCGRAMPGPGSYVLLDGRPHCAACAASHARRPRPASPEAGRDADDPRCDACDRALGGPAPEIQGFRLCAACRSSDPELALALARARHQRRLARASRRILDGDDD